MAERILVQQTSAGEPVAAGDIKIYPVARSYRLNFPSGHGGIVWNRPRSVIVEDVMGRRQIIPIQDYTRRMQIFILAAGLITALLTWLIFRNSKS
ncbi:MAG: hypothetical protein ACWGN2_04255 [Anaerolineales bacterium]